MKIQRRRELKGDIWNLTIFGKIEKNVKRLSRLCQWRQTQVLLCCMSYCRFGDRSTWYMHLQKLKFYSTRVHLAFHFLKLFFFFLPYHFYPLFNLLDSHRHRLLQLESNLSDSLSFFNIETRTENRLNSSQTWWNWPLVFQSPSRNDKVFRSSFI